MKQIIVWFNSSKNYYYWRKVSGTYVDYFIGYQNQYGHEVILIIEQKDFEVVYYHKISLKKKVLTRTISFLQKIDKK